MSVSITVNGAGVDFESPPTVAELLVHLGTTGPCAVEVNRDVVPRREHAERPLADGDVVEIVTLVGGG
jgi:sulfur carrier protein